MTDQIDLARYIRPGDTIFVGQGTAEPRALVEALIEQRHALGPVRVFVGASYTGLFRPEHAGSLAFLGWGAVGGTASLVAADVLELLPIHLGELPRLITSGRLRVDVVLAQMSPPDHNGNHSLGLVADCQQLAIGAARVTMAEINPHVPFTSGDTLVHTSQVTVGVDDDRALIEVVRRVPSEQDLAIADHVASLIPDGATLQIGVGATPDAVLERLRHATDLGVHSGLLTDAMFELIEAGVVTNSRKEIDTGVSVTGALFGTAPLYRWADRNPSLRMRSLAYTHDPRVLAALESLFAVNSAIEVDLSGQINAEVAAGRYVGTVGGQGYFARAATTSAHGRSIVALPSVARGGSVSRIVATLGDGIVTTARADADVVVTEHGVADLRGASLAERSARLIAIADPRHRDDLERHVHLKRSAG